MVGEAMITILVILCLMSAWTFIVPAVATILVTYFAVYALVKG